MPDHLMGRVDRGAITGACRAYEFEDPRPGLDDQGCIPESSSCSRRVALHRSADYSTLSHSMRKLY